MRRYTSNLNDRGAYRKDLHKVATAGGRALRNFLTRHGYLFPGTEGPRVLRMLDVLGSANVAHVVDHKFRAYAGQAHDPVIESADYPTVVETIITPGEFLRHLQG